MLLPRQKTPALEVDLVSGSRFSTTDIRSERGVLISVYRGFHCPICALYLTELEKLTPDFAERGVSTVAISTDDKDRGQKMAERIEAKSLDIGYGMSLAAAREWGLFISTSRGKTSIGIEEPAMFAEPGLFLVRPDQTLYYSYVQTMPFVRPNFKELLKALDTVIEKDYPARGEYSGPV
jgi:peroxiredoxin